MKKTLIFRKGDLVRLKHGQVSKVSKGVKEYYFPNNKVIGKEGETFLVDTDPEKAGVFYKIIDKIEHTSFLEDTTDGELKVWAFDNELIMVKPGTSMLRQTIGYIFGWMAFYTGLLLMIFGQWVSNWAGIELDSDEDNVGTDGSALEATVPCFHGPYHDGDISKWEEIMRQSDLAQEEEAKKNERPLRELRREPPTMGIGY